HSTTFSTPVQLLILRALALARPRCSFFFLLTRRPPISTLFPYTTLFRSEKGPSASLAPSAARSPYSKYGSRAALGRHASRTSSRSEEHTSELQSRGHLVCRLLLEKKKTIRHPPCTTSQAELRAHFRLKAT